MALLDAERSNLDAAMQWSVDHQSDVAIALAAELRHYWLIRGYLGQGLAWLDQALGQSPSEVSRTRAAGLAGAALLARLAGDFVRAKSFAEEGIDVGRASGSRRNVVTCLGVLTAIAGLAGDYDRARAHGDEAVGIARSLGSTRIEAIASFILAEAALHTRRYRDLHEVGGRALELSRAAGDQEGMALALSCLGLGALQENRLETASSQLLEALEYATDLGFPGVGSRCCFGLAALTARKGQTGLAARLLGAAEAFGRAGGSLLLPAVAAARDDALATIRGTLPDDEIRSAFDEGRRLHLDEALAEARGILASDVTVL